MGQRRQCSTGSTELRPILLMCEKVRSQNSRIRTFILEADRKQIFVFRLKNTIHQKALSFGWILIKSSDLVRFGVLASEG